MSILNSLKGMMTNELVSATASHLGESPEGVTKAMGGIFPTLLSGIMNSKTEDHSMLSGLLNQASSASTGSNLVGDLVGGLKGGSNAGITGIGSSLVSGLMGNKMGMVGDLISKFSGVSSGSSSTLMGLGGSLVASLLGSKMANGGISGVMSMLGNHKDEIAAATPAGFASSLGFSNMVSNASGKVSDAASSVASSITGGNDNDNKGGGMKWLLPLLILGLLALGIFSWMKGCNKSGDTSATVTTATTGDSAASANSSTVTANDTANHAASTTATTAAVESIKVKLADGTEINANKGSLEDKLVSFINDPNSVAGKDNWFNFNNLTFETNKATLKPGGETQINNIAAILKAYPKLKLKIGGYTDNVGKEEANVKLSGERAQTVYNELVAKGASKTQFDAKASEGYGSQHPIASNDTEEGRAQNRRIAVSVREK